MNEVSRFAPQLKVFLARPLYFFDDNDSRFMAALLLLCDKIFAIDLHKRCYEQEDVDKARGFFLSFAQESWCQAAYAEGILEEPEETEEMVQDCVDGIKSQVEAGQLPRNRLHPEWSVNPELLLPKVHERIVENICLKTERSVLPVTDGVETEEVTVDENIALVCHYFLSKVSLSVALPRIPEFENSEQVLQLRQECLRSGELAEFQSYIRSLTAKLNTFFLQGINLPEIRTWAQAEAETTVRLSLFELEKRIDSLQGSGILGVLKDKKVIGSIISLVNPASWIEAIIKTVQNAPDVVKRIMDAVDPETRMLKRNPQLAYLYRLGKMT